MTGVRPRFGGQSVGCRFLRGQNLRGQNLGGHNLSSPYKAAAPRGIRASLRGLCLSLACLTGAAALPALTLALTATPAWAEPLRLSRPEARQAASDMLRSRQNRPARQIALGLLKADPRDVSALLLLSRAELGLGDSKAAARAARRAWTLAGDKPQQYAAAYAMAQAMNAADRHTAGQFWLRRASQVAPDARFDQLAQTEFRKMRNRNRAHLQLRFNIAPSSNINNGSVETWTPDGAPFTFTPIGGQLPLSGVEFSTGAVLKYRLGPQNKHRVTRLVLEADQRSYALSDRAKARAPGLRGSDFAFGAFAAGIEHTLVAPDGRAAWQVRAGLGRSWYGGDKLTDFGDLTLGYTRVLKGGDRLSFSLRREQQWATNSQQNMAIWRLGAGWTHALAGGDKLALGLGLVRAHSRDVRQDFTRAELSARYIKGQPVLGMGLEFGLALSARRHQTYPFSNDGQSGVEARASVAARLENMEYYGFVPVLTLSARRSTSNIPLFETRSLGLSLGLQSAF